MNNEMKAISNRIKSRRTELKLSFQDLASLSGMSKSTLQRYETGGIKNIPLSKLKSLSIALQTTPEWIMGLGNVNISSDTELISKLFERLNDCNRDKVLELARMYLDAQDNK